MKIIIAFFIVFLLSSCETKEPPMSKIIFLHHSTGQRIWIGGTNRYLYKIAKKNDVQSHFERLNKKNKTSHSLSERSFPSETPYGWKNYPFDYYNIWVKNAGDKPYMNEPTLEMLTRIYDIIIFKHCYPVSKIIADTGNPDINSEERKLENYKLQYNALKEKMHEFPKNKFIVWTPAVHVKNNITADEAQRTRDFYNWIMSTWDQPGDNIFVWDFYSLETEGNLYLPEKYAAGVNDSHPNKEFAARIAPLFSKFIMDVANNIIE